jgi:hypothetical protein
MKKWQKFNLIFFLCLVSLTSCIVYFLGKTTVSTAFEKPWHLQPAIHEDSLSLESKNLYKIFDKRRLYSHFKDTSRTQIMILVDSWGVPVEDSLLKEDFAIFADIPHIFALHQRLANRTKHAELTELRDNAPSNIFLFGGDSTEYDRKQYLQEIRFSRTFFCQHCSDSFMIAKMDSVMTQDSVAYVAWTTQSSRIGDRDSLHHSLRLVVEFAKRHPEASVIVQGTHRPTLGSPETRNRYKAHWVPAVILNIR